MADVVDPEAIREVAKKLGADDGPRMYLLNAAKELADAKLPGGALTFLGGDAVDAHNEAANKHRQNLEKGAEHLTKMAKALNGVAANWEKSDQPWVVK
jgi:uncharacterized protein YukE